MLTNPQGELEKLQRDFAEHNHDGRNSKSLSVDVPSQLSNAPLATISDPSGGSTIDNEARAAIDTIIDRLQSLGLIN